MSDRPPYSSSYADRRLQHTAKRMSHRLNVIVEALEARGIGPTFCDCPSSEAIQAKQNVMLFLGLELVEVPTAMCERHNPKPARKPTKGLGDILRRLFPVFPP